MRKFVLAYKFTTNIPAKLTSLGAARSFSRMKLEFPPMKLKFLTYETRVSYLGNWSFTPMELECQPMLAMAHRPIQAQSKGATPRLIGLSAAPFIKVRLLTLLSGISHRD